jgi:hypothetical protein
MTFFNAKQFMGVLYEFTHLNPKQIQVPLNSLKTAFVELHVTFGCHCFTESFDDAIHQEHHRYTHKGELRAFDVPRYDCSLQLPTIMQAMLAGTIYYAEESYTYVAQINIQGAQGTQAYSVFFSLEKNKEIEEPALRMFVKSAYLRPLAAKKNAQTWRFVSLAGQISGAFPPKEKKPKPKKKKAP